jgi:copper chaperone
MPAGKDWQIAADADWRAEDLCPGTLDPPTLGETILLTATQTKEARMQLHIENMTCSGCVRTVTRAIHSVDPAATVHADPEHHTVEVETSAPRAGIEAALADAGYPAAREKA